MTKRFYIIASFVLVVELFVLFYTVFTNRFAAKDKARSDLVDAKQLNCYDMKCVWYCSIVWRCDRTKDRPLVKNSDISKNFGKIRSDCGYFSRVLFISETSNEEVMRLQSGFWMCWSTLCCALLCTTEVSAKARQGRGRGSMWWWVELS